MMQATVVSDKFPGINLFCPDEPDTLLPKPGSYMFYVGIPRVVTAATKGAIVNALANFPPHVQNHLNVQFSDAIAPDPEAVKSESVIAESAETTEDENPIELNEDDLDLISVELSKLVGKPAAEVEPILIATGGNPDLPKALRTEYLKQVVRHPKLGKALKAVAEKLAEQI
jgi:hypothetical protein